MWPMIPFAHHICPHKRDNMMKPTSQRPLLRSLSSQWRTHKGFDSSISTGTSPKESNTYIFVAKRDKW